jgi:hypothetical protein
MAQGQIPPSAQLFLQGFQLSQAKKEREEKEKEARQRFEIQLLTTLGTVATKNASMANKLLKAFQSKGYAGGAEPFKVPKIGEIPVTRRTKTEYELLTKEAGIAPEEALRGMFDIPEDEPEKLSTVEIKLQEARKLGATGQQQLEILGIGKKAGKAPKTIPLSVGNGEELQHQWDEEKQTWVPVPGAKPRPIFKPTAGKDVKTRTLERLASDYFQAIGRYGSAARGVGQFLEDPNKAMVATFHHKQAQIIAEQYKNMGGNLADLGITQSEYTSPEEVRAALKAGKITREEADRIALEQWPELFKTKKK